VADLTGLAPGDHVCWSYASPDEFWSGTAGYLAEGARAGDKLLLFTESLAPDDAVARLGAEGLDAARLCDAGQLAVVPAPSAYLTDGRFDADAVLDAFSVNSRGARAEGWRALRATGEIAWVLPYERDLESYLAYELRADAAVAEGNLIGVCAYHSAESDPEWMVGLETVHPTQLRGPVALPPTSFSVSMSPSGDVVVDGEIDLDMVASFRRALDVAARVSDSVVLDLSGLSFLNVPGFRALADLANDLGAGGRALALRDAPPLFRRCWRLLGYDRLANVTVT
jgi:anti-anti-sigma regulatory factor